MKKLLVLAFFPLFISASVTPIKIDGVELGKEETIKNVTIRSGEKEDSRLYHATYHTTFDGQLEPALKYVIDFSSRCNNSYRKERKFLDKAVDCAIHNENLIETQIVRKLKKQEDVPGMIDQFVLKRRIWNKGLHSYNDLVTIKELKPSSDEARVVEVSYRLLDDKESKSFIDDPVPFDNAFYYTVGTYTLAQMKNGKLDVKYSYTTKTDHWFLTAGMIQGSIYNSIANGVRLSTDGIATVLKD